MSETKVTTVRELNISVGALEARLDAHLDVARDLRELVSAYMLGKDSLRDETERIARTLLGGPYDDEARQALFLIGAKP